MLWKNATTVRANDSAKDRFRRRDELKGLLSALDTYLSGARSQDRKIDDVADTINDDLSDDERAAMLAEDEEALDLRHSWRPSVLS